MGKHVESILPVKSEISEDLMIDDVGTIESSEDEESDTQLALPMPTYSAIASKEAIPDVMEEDQKEAEQVIPVSGPHQTLIVCDDDKIVPEDVDEEGFKAVLNKSQKRSRNSSRISVSDSSGASKHVESSLPVKSEMCEDWMIDDVGTIESSDDEDEMAKHQKETEIKNVKDSKKSKSECEPVLGEEWMIDDVGTIESSEDEESDTQLALPMPTHSAIASKEAIPDVMEEDLKEAEQVIPLSGPHQTLIVCDDNKTIPEDVDEEGFKEVFN